MSETDCPHPSWYHFGRAKTCTLCGLTDEGSEENRARDLDETLRFCIRQERGGACAPNGTVCTGAFDPFHLRSGESVFEPQIQEILRKNKIYGVTP